MQLLAEDRKLSIQEVLGLLLSATQSREAANKGTQFTSITNIFYDICAVMYGVLPII
jgi:hypothetical protein